MDIFLPSPEWDSWFVFIPSRNSVSQSMKQQSCVSVGICRRCIIAVFAVNSGGGHRHLKCTNICKSKYNANLDQQMLRPVIWKSVAAAGLDRPATLRVDWHAHPRGSVAGARARRVPLNPPARQIADIFTCGMLPSPEFHWHFFPLHQHCFAIAPSLVMKYTRVRRRHPPPPYQCPKCLPLLNHPPTNYY